MLPLLMAQLGTAYTIEKIGGKEETKKFLSSLGFVAGSQIIIVNDVSGNLIVSIKDTRIAISKEMAQKIMVV